MLKDIKTAPPDKWSKAPAIIKDENTRFHETCDATVKKYAGVQIVSSPYHVTKEYRDNYSSVFGHD